MLESTSKGLYCPAGDFYIDPFRAVDKAVITHVHGDHARWGMDHYFCHAHSEPILRHRINPDIKVTAFEYGEAFQLGPVKLSLHSAGHILGSAQVRLELDGEVWVVTGDFKRNFDPSCAPFEVVTCDTFVTETTFAYPIYRWPDTRSEVEKIYNWWRINQQQERDSLLFCYSLGKAQRVLAHLAEFSDETVYLHGAAVRLTEIYRELGIKMIPTEPLPAAKSEEAKSLPPGQLIVAPPSAAGSPWMRRFKNAVTGFCSGWMQVRGNRRRRGYDRGFIISDHADWDGLMQTITDTGAQHILTMHGSDQLILRYLNEVGLNAEAMKDFERPAMADYEDDG